MAKQIKIKGVKLVKHEHPQLVISNTSLEAVEDVVEEVVEAPKPIRKKKVKPSSVKVSDELRGKVLDLEYLKDIYEDATDIVSASDRKIQDLLHDLENEDLSYHDIAALGKELKNLRTERRKAKDTEILLKDLYDILKDGQTVHVFSRLKSEANKIKNKESKMKDRVYVYREQ